MMGSYSVVTRSDRGSIDIDGNLGVFRVRLAGQKRYSYLPIIAGQYPGDIQIGKKSRTFWGAMICAYESKIRLATWHGRDYRNRIDEIFSK